MALLIKRDWKKGPYLDARFLACPMAWVSLLQTLQQKSILRTTEGGEEL